MTFFFGNSQSIIFWVLQSLVGTSWAKCVRKNCHAGSDLQSCGSDSQLWVRCDDLQKYFLKAPWLLKPQLVAGKKVPGKARKLCPEGREPDPGGEGKDLLSKLKIIHSYLLKYHACKGEGCLIPSQGFAVPTLPFFPPWTPLAVQGILWIYNTAGAYCRWGSLSIFKMGWNAEFLLGAAKIKIWCLLIQVHEPLQSPNTWEVSPARGAVSFLYPVATPLFSFLPLYFHPVLVLLFFSPFLFFLSFPFKSVFFFCACFPSMPVFSSLSYRGLVLELTASLFVGNFVLALLLLSMAHLFAPVKEKKKTKNFSNLRVRCLPRDPCLNLCCKIFFFFLWSTKEIIALSLTNRTWLLSPHTPEPWCKSWAVPSACINLIRETPFQSWSLEDAHWGRFCREVAQWKHFLQQWVPKEIGWRLHPCYNKKECIFSGRNIFRLF